MPQELELLRALTSSSELSEEKTMTSSVRKTSPPAEVSNTPEASWESTASGLSLAQASNASSESSNVLSTISHDVIRDLELGTLPGVAVALCAPPAKDVTSESDNVKSLPVGKTYDLRIDKLSYLVQGKGTVLRKLPRKCLLKGVSACANHGEILAVAGASGAGKTTFLDAVAGIISPSHLKGSILVNGQPVSRSFRSISGYVTQDDFLLPMLTVQETLLFSARLRLPESVGYQEKVARVETLLTQLGLISCKDTLIGNADVRGVSGGERRRTSIGVDLVHDPRVLFLDEPTSGLDSCAALTVMKILKNLAESEGRTIILTIHQPSARILRLIDRFLILWRGRAVYHGCYSKMKQFFEEFGGGVNDADEMDALEFALDAIREGERERKKLLRCSDDFGNWRQDVTVAPSSPEGDLPVGEGRKEVLHSELSKHTDKDTDEREEGSSGTPCTSYSCSFLLEVFILSERCVKTILRTKELFLARILIFVLCGIIAGTLFLNSGQDLDGANHRLSFFAYTVAAAFFTSTDAIPAFLEERHIFIRESSRGAYRTASYVIAGALVHLPFLILIASIYSVIPYYMIGLAPAFGNFLMFTITVFLSLAVANSFVCFVASIVPNFTLGSAMSTALSALFFLFSGFFISTSKIPPYWIWMNYISTFKYPLQLLILNEFGGSPDKCWDYAQGPQKEETQICVFSSQDVLRKFSAENVSMWVPATVMLSFYVGYRIMFYAILRVHSARKRT